MIKKNKLGWYLVRSIAELQVLSKATYSILIIVPILAGLWSAITFGVNGYNQVIYESTKKLEHIVEKVDNYDGRIKQDIGKIRKEISNIRNKLEKANIQDLYLPSIWVFTFFSALMAILGQLIYSLFSPKRVKDYAEVDYIKYMIDRHKITNSFKNTGDSEKRAMKSYASLSNKHRYACLSSISLYFLSIVSIFIVIITQFKNILAVAGWL